MNLLWEDLFIVHCPNTVSLNVCALINTYHKYYTHSENTHTHTYATTLTHRIKDNTHKHIKPHTYKHNTQNQGQLCP